MAASVPASSLVSRSVRPDLGLPPAVIHAPVIVTDFPQDAAESRSRSWAEPRRAQQDTDVLDRTAAPRQAAADAQACCDIATASPERYQSDTHSPVLWSTATNRAAGDVMALVPVLDA